MKFGQKQDLDLMDEFLQDPDLQELLPPKREDFCWFIRLDWKENGGAFVDTSNSKPEFKWPNLPYRPVPVTEIGLDLSNFAVAGLEHVSDTYRLYYYGKGSKGVFRNGNLVCESIPMDEEMQRCVGLLIYNDHEYQKAMLDHKNYWTWKKERNPQRWISQESGEVDFDVKNLQHCMRLLISGEAILKTGEPIIRFEGETLQYLRDIRAGKFKYEQLMADVEKRMESLKVIYEASTLPWGADIDGIDNLYRELIMS